MQNRNKDQYRLYLRTAIYTLKVLEDEFKFYFMALMASVVQTMPLPKTLVGTFTMDTSFITNNQQIQMLTDFYKFIANVYQELEKKNNIVAPDAKDYWNMVHEQGLGLQDDSAEPLWLLNFHTLAMKANDKGRKGEVYCHPTYHNRAFPEDFTSIEMQMSHYFTGMADLLKTRVEDLMKMVTKMEKTRGGVADDFDSIIDGFDENQKTLFELSCFCMQISQDIRAFQPFPFRQRKASGPFGEANPN